MFGHNDNDHQTVNTVPPAPEPTPDASLGDPDTSLPPATPHLTVPSPSTDDTAAATPATAAPAVPGTTAPGNPNDLLDIKQEALQQLSPLIGHLDQTPEEKFRTTMMLIQATDDHSKIKEAYEAAQNITDEKVRAQALLDVVNEINYFTQQHHDEKEV